MLKKVLEVLLRNCNYCTTEIHDELPDVSEKKCSFACQTTNEFLINAKNRSVQCTEDLSTEKKNAEVACQLSTCPAFTKQIEKAQDAHSLKNLARVEFASKPDVSLAALKFSLRLAAKFRNRLRPVSINFHVGGDPRSSCCGETGRENVKALCIKIEMPPSTETCSCQECQDRCHLKLGNVSNFANNARQSKLKHTRKLTQTEYHGLLNIPWSCTCKKSRTNRID